MTRTEALKIAQDAIKKSMDAAYRKWKLYDGGTLKTPEQKAVYEKQYSELAQALAVIENMARQKEMHL